MKIEGHTAIVTGGSSGLGQSVVRALANQGANAAIFDVDEQKGLQTSASLGDSIRFFKTDVTNETEVSLSVEKVIEAFGAIHILINCAGVVVPARIISRSGSISVEQFNRVIQINLTGTLIAVKLVVEKMLKNPGNNDGEKGVIINTASVAAFDGQIGQVAYSASKAAIVGMTLPLAREFAEYGLRAVTIAPGLFETPMVAGLPEKAKESLVSQIPFPKRLGKPKEYAALVRHVIENPLLNGETIRIDQALRMGSK